jgi:hypothetical protein
MNENLDIFLHGSYVALTFAVLLFGALAFRQVLDNADVKALHMGEDRDAFVDAVGATFLGVGTVLLVPVTIYCYGIAPPSIYAYAVPLVGGAQLLQLALRLLFQRTLVRTRGLVVRSMLFEKLRAVPFQDIVVVRLVAAGLWTDVRISLPAEEVGFRIFSASAPTLERLLTSSCNAPVLWILKGADESRRQPPAST